eukprot:PhM_4_TR15356/c0_g2_i1/m.42178
MWATTAIVCNAFSTTISTQALLQGFFLDSTAVTWMLKDILPHFLSTFIIGSIGTFETRSKFWFMVSVLLFQVCVVMEFIIAFAFPPEYLLLGGITVALGKSVSFLITGISRAAFHQHFATNQNLSDITKCFSSVVLISYTLASALGLAFVAAVPQTYFQCAALCVTSMLSVVTARRAVGPINLRTLNRLSMGCIASQFVKSNFTSIPTPKEVSDLVGLRCVAPPSDAMACEIRVNPKLDSLTLDHHFNEVYVLFSDTLAKRIVVCVTEHKHLVLLVKGGSSVRDVVFGMVLCEHLRLKHTANEGGHLCADSVYKELKSLVHEKELWENRMDQLFCLFEEEGWDCATHCIDHASMRLERVVDEDQKKD